MSATRAAGGVPFVDLRAQLRSLEPELRAAIDEVLSSGDFVLGAAVERFERGFARYCGVSHAVGVSSGLDALRLILTGLGIGAGDDVVVPASTFIATALAVTACGARLVLADCDEGTGNLSPSALDKAFTPRTKAVIAVHLGGQPAAMDELAALCRARGAVLIEDAAQAHGARYAGRRAGSLARAAAFSFYPAKNLGALGDGGCVTTDDPALAERLRRLRNYGQREKYDHVDQGLNARLDSLQAAVLSVKLPHLDAWNAARARAAALYRERLAGVGDLSFQAAEPRADGVHHLFFVETSRRDALREALAADGVETGIHYPKPIHLQAAYAGLGLRRGVLPNAERRAERTLSLPMHAELLPAQAEAVCAAVRRFFERGA